jgi:hypothetical protein
MKKILTKKAWHWKTQEEKQLRHRMREKQQKDSDKAFNSLMESTYQRLTNI